MYRKLLLVFTAFAAAFFAIMRTPQPTFAASPIANIWETTGDQSQLLSQQPAISFAPDSGSNPLTITVNPSTK